MELSSRQESSATSVDLGILSNEDYFDPINMPEKWTPRMRKPLGFDTVAQIRFQKYIDRITGLSHGGHSILKLEWGPDVLGWQPYPHGSNPIGYTQPTWLALWDSEGNDVAAPRWVLSQRCEPEQYMPGWEDGRWVWMDTPNRVVLYDDLGNEITEKGKLHDVKGDPPPNGLYTPLHCHTVHHSGCCLRPRNETHCWGFYLPPNEALLELIAEMAGDARTRKDVNPTSNVAHLKENAQSVNRVKAKLEAAKLGPNNSITFTPIVKESPHQWRLRD